MESQEQKHEIDLGEIFDILKHRWLLIVGMTVTTTVIAILLSIFVLTPKYQTSTTMLVNYKQNQEISYTYNDMMMSQTLVNTYSEIIKSRLVIEQVTTGLNLTDELTPSEVAKIISVSPVGDTEILRLTVKHEDPVLATNLVNNVANIFQEEIKDLMEVDSVKIIDRALIPVNPVEPNKVMNTIFGAMLGFIVSVVITFLLAFMDRTMKIPQDIERYLGLPLVGAIPDLKIEEVR